MCRCVLKRRGQGKKKIKQIKLRESWYDRVQGTAVSTSKGSRRSSPRELGLAHHAEQMGIQDIRRDQWVSYTEHSVSREMFRPLRLQNEQEMTCQSTYTCALQMDHGSSPSRSPCSINSGQVEKNQKNKLSDLPQDINFAVYKSGEGVQAENRDLQVNGRDFQNREEAHSK